MMVFTRRGTSPHPHPFAVKGLQNGGVYKPPVVAFIWGGAVKGLQNSFSSNIIDNELYR